MSRFSEAYNKHKKALNEVLIDQGKILDNMNMSSSPAISVLAREAGVHAAEYEDYLKV